ncbi:MAG: hypothetical protein Tsb0020_36920 [Haliangiales bacterium]
MGSSIEHLREQLAKLKAENAELAGEAAKLKAENEALRERARGMRHLEDIVRVHAALEGRRDLDELFGAALGVLCAVLECDRACLLHPCRPNARFLEVVAVESTIASPMMTERGQNLTVDLELAQTLAKLLARNAPVTFGDGNEQHLTSLAEAFGGQSEMWRALRVRTGEPWLLGVQQCRGARRWSVEERQLFDDAARRISEEIGTFLSFQSSRINEERYRSLLAALPDLIFVFDADGYLIEVFPPEHEVLQTVPFELVGRSLSEVLPAAVVKILERSIARTRERGSVQAAEYMLELPAGRRWFSARMALAGRDGRVICVSRDITARRELEGQLIHAQKMESVGRLAGGVSHDFNNLLTAVMAHADLALEEVDSESPVGGDLVLIREAAARGAALTRQLLSFARKQVMQPQVVDLNELLLEVDILLRRLIGADIEMVTVPHPTLDLVEVDRVQFEQVLVNLAINARDAMPSGGRLLLETENRVLSDSDVCAYPALGPGAYVLLRVSDSGVGMSEEVASHVFEPFFTTKEVGKGTGLGLATCYGIVKQCGGDLRVHSVVGEGTTFEVVLPRVEGVAEASQSDHESPVEPSAGTETVLIVEDEPTVRQVVRRTLERFGYRVLSAANGDEALAIDRQALVKVELLLTDLVMPRMSGHQLAKRMRQLCPGLKVLYVSGYTGDTAPHVAIAKSDAAFLQKPFTPVVLARRVRELLDA